ncbi:hypothetical protein BD289DRAFT_1217 [Coniella lustricola]|uniref:Hydrophobin n=1 Tax=Coniella lustricola TaxID=2025994 RepID=A0A2T3ANK1_9PEZI|nr:hypothetical protein BD289DRAFT_1217 [Coniella lustricola]
MKKYALLFTPCLLRTATAAAITNTDAEVDANILSLQFPFANPDRNAAPETKPKLSRSLNTRTALTIDQAQQACGDNAVLSCCSQQTHSGDSTTATNDNSGFLSGLLGGLLGGGGLLEDGLALLSGCLSVPIDIGLINIDDLLDNQCKQTAACCSSGDVNEGGLIDISVGCISLNLAISLL